MRNLRPNITFRLSRGSIQRIILARFESGNFRLAQIIPPTAIRLLAKAFGRGGRGRRSSSGSRQLRSSSQSRYRAITAATRAGRSATGRSTSSIGGGWSARGSPISCFSYSGTWRGSFQSCSWPRGSSCSSTANILRPASCGQPAESDSRWCSWPRAGWPPCTTATRARFRKGSGRGVSWAPSSVMRSSPRSTSWAPRWSCWACCSWAGRC